MARAAALPCWSGPVEIEPVSGGITNSNFLVQDHGERLFVRIGDDIPVHGVWRWNELAASRAAHAADVSPEVVYAEPGATVLRFIEGATLRPEDLRHTHTLALAISLIRRCHLQIPNHHRGPNVLFWVFQVLRSYLATLRTANSPHVGKLGRLQKLAAQLEEDVGAVHITFGHNDLLAANFIDDGTRLWIVDWEYAGFNSPLFDLGGLASNNELPRDQEMWMLETYFQAPVTALVWRSYSAMKCASLLRETMWSMVSEIHSTLAFDYVAYTEENLRRFEAAYNAHEGWQR